MNVKYYHLIAIIFILSIVNCGDDDSRGLNNSFESTLNDGLVKHFELMNSLVDEITQRFLIETYPIAWGTGPGSMPFSANVEGNRGSLSFANDESINFGVEQDFSIAMFVRFGDQLTPEFSTNSLISKWCDEANNCNNPYPYLIEVTNENHEFSGAFLFSRSDWSADQYCRQYIRLQTRGGFNDNRWHHLVVSRSANELRIYVDGLLEVVDFDPTRAYCGTKNESPLIIGRKSLFNRDFAFTGAISDLRFYNRSLDSEEVMMLSDANR